MVGMIRMATLGRLCGLLLLVVGLAACGGSGSTEGAGAPAEDGDAPGIEPGAFIQSERPRESEPDVSEDDIEAAAASVNRFAFAFHEQLRGEETAENWIYSPYSMSLAFAMLSGGAKGDTLAQMEQAMAYQLGQQALHPAFNALDASLTELDGQEGVTFNRANSFWAQSDYEFVSEYLDLLAVHYGAGIHRVDYRDATARAAAAEAINDWVDVETAGLIERIVDGDQLTEFTRFVLVNALYLNADWRQPFAPEATEERIFTDLTGQERSVETMHHPELGAAHYQDEVLQAVELPYAGERLAMLVVQPRAGYFETVQDQLSLEWLQALLGDLEPGPIDLALPRFDAELGLDLPPHLEAMGMALAFDEQADFTGIKDPAALIEGERLFVQFANHEAVVDVDEAGTEAAAATAIGAGVTSVPAIQARIRIDRPFLFAIRDRQTGVLLFLGQVLDPEG